jgi:hypothetical protein
MLRPGRTGKSSDLPAVVTRHPLKRTAKRAADADLTRVIHDLWSRIASIRVVDSRGLGRRRGVVRRTDANIRAASADSIRLATDTSPDHRSSASIEPPATVGFLSFSRSRVNKATASSGSVHRATKDRARRSLLRLYAFTSSLRASARTLADGVHNSAASEDDNRSATAANFHGKPPSGLALTWAANV